MSIFKRVKESIRTNFNRRTEGKHNCIPFPFKRLSKFLPGIIKGVYYCVTAGTGEGKTQFTKFVFVKSVYKFYKENPDSGIKPHIIYFLLEESKEDFIASLTIDELWNKYGIRIDMYDLQSYRHALDPNIVEKLDELDEYFAEFEQIVELIDTISNPTGIFKHIREYSRRNGTHYYTPLLTEGSAYITQSEYYELVEAERTGWKYSHYKPNDPNEHVLIIADHLSLLSTEKGALSLHAAMQRLSSDYFVMQVLKHYKYSVIGVQQQQMSGQNIEHFKAGLLTPDLAKLGDNKLLARDYFVVFGLFSPYLHELDEDIGYDITRLKRYYRRLSVLKHRNGVSNIDVGLFFDGGTRTFAELPKKDNAVGMNKVYSTIDSLESTYFS